MLPLACLTLGILLGMIGGLHIALALMQGLTQRLDDLERKDFAEGLTSGKIDANVCKELS